MWYNKKIKKEIQNRKFKHPNNWKVQYHEETQKNWFLEIERENEIMF